MAIKAANQLTLIDVTDAYSVILTSEAYTFVGGTSGVAANNTCETQAVAYCGSTQCQSVHIGTVTCPTGISASVINNNTASPTIKFTTSATVSTACEAIIPVTVDGVTVNKKFSFAVAKTGATGQAGENGTNGTNGKDGKDGKDGANGADAITVTITSSNGTVFKNSSGSTVLTAHVFKGGVEQSITDAGVVANSLGQIKWYKGTGTTPVATTKTVTVSANDVTNSLLYTCQLE